MPLLPRSSRLFLSCLLAFVLVAPLANGADKTPLSALSRLPAVRDATDLSGTTTLPGLTVKDGSAGTPSFVEVKAATAQGYCLATREGVIGLRESMFNPESGELWRFLEKDDKATLESTRFSIMLADKRVWVKSRTSVALQPVARANGVTVWSFRESNGDVVLLARGGSSGRQSPAPDAKNPTNDAAFVSSDCTFGATRLIGAKARASAVAQLTGHFPPVAPVAGEKRDPGRWIADATVSQLGRDPELILAVRLRNAAD